MKKNLRNSTFGKINHKCRCCKNPSTNFMELESSVKIVGGIKKTYKDLLYEITKLNITSCQENIMPQQICNKCGTQLVNSFKFIQQACKVSEEYIEVVEQNKKEDIKAIEQLEETLIEAPVADDSQEEMKVEPLDIEIKIEIKEEKEESEENILYTTNEESQEKKNFLENSDSDNSSEDDVSSDEPESLHDNTDLSKEPIARCCDICHKVYRNERFLKIHKRFTHMPEESKIPCPLCNYKASRPSSLKVHIGLVHGCDKVSEYFKPVETTAKEYPCTLCSRSYGRKDSLRRHIRRVHSKTSKGETNKSLKSEKPKEKERFLCTYCGKSYSLKSTLDIHILSHTGERPFPCEICTKTFKRSKDLQLHSLIHSDEKPHQCFECGKAFKRIDKLKFHMRVHSELRPYKCTECEKTFKYPSVLKTHMYIHTGQT